MTNWGAFLSRIIWLSLSMQFVMLCAGFAQDKPCYPPTYSPVPNILELTYHEARKQLTASAWQPFQSKPNTVNTDNDPDISYGNGQIFWEKEYLELEFCSGTGSAACGFLFSDVYGNRLEIITEGEELPENDAYAIVTKFRFVCSSE